MVDINKFVDGQMAAWARNDLIGRLTHVGHALVQTGLKVNGVRYKDVVVGPLLLKAAAALEECWKREGLIQSEAKPENPDDVVVKVTVPDRWPMTEAGQRRAAQESAAPVRHGRWETHYRSGTTVPKGVVSGCCDMWNERKTPYCPYCGATMDGGAENG